MMTKAGKDRNIKHTTGALQLATLRGQQMHVALETIESGEVLLTLQSAKALAMLNDIDFTHVGDEYIASTSYLSRTPTMVTKRGVTSPETFAERRNIVFARSVMYMMSRLNEIITGE